MNVLLDIGLQHSVQVIFHIFKRLLIFFAYVLVKDVVAIRKALMVIYLVTVVDNVIVFLAGQDSNVILVQVDTTIQLENVCLVGAIPLVPMVVQVLALTELIVSVQSDLLVSNVTLVFLAFIPLDRPATNVNVTSMESMWKIGVVQKTSMMVSVKMKQEIVELAFLGKYEILKYQHYTSL